MEFWTASYLMYTVVSIISIFYVHVFNIYIYIYIPKINSELRRVKMFVFFHVALKSNLWTKNTCTSHALTMLRWQYQAVALLPWISPTWEAGQIAQNWGKVDSQAEASLLVYRAQRNIPRYTLWLMKLRMFMGSHSSSSQEERWLTTKRFVCKTSLDFIAGSWGIGRAWANRPSGIAITKVPRSAQILLDYRWIDRWMDGR